MPRDSQTGNHLLVMVIGCTMQGSLHQTPILHEIVNGGKKPLYTSFIPEASKMLMGMASPT